MNRNIYKGEILRNNMKKERKRNLLEKNENRIILLKVIISVVLALLLILSYDLLLFDPSNVLNILLSVLLAATLLFFSGLGIAFLLIFPPILSKSKKKTKK